MGKGGAISMGYYHSKENPRLPRAKTSTSISISCGSVSKLSKLFPSLRRRRRSPPPPKTPAPLPPPAALTLKQVLDLERQQFEPPPPLVKTKTPRPHVPERPIRPIVIPPLPLSVPISNTPPPALSDSFSNVFSSSSFSSSSTTTATATTTSFSSSDLLASSSLRFGHKKYPLEGAGGVERCYSTISSSIPISTTDSSSNPSLSLDPFASSSISLRSSSCIGEDAAAAAAAATAPSPSLQDFRALIQKLHATADGYEAPREAALAISELAAKDKHCRVALGMLGAVPPLVSMLCSTVPHTAQESAVLALLNLSVGNPSNNTVIVKDGVVPHLVLLLGSEYVEIREASLALFLNLSSLEINKPIIGRNRCVVPKLICVASDCTDPNVQKNALRVLCHLSTCVANAKSMLDCGVVPLLVPMVIDIDVANKALALMASLTSTKEGRLAMAKETNVYNNLIEVLGWNDLPKCQERASYILVIMSCYGTLGDRRAMVEAGIVSALLELVLMGTTIAQKFASRVLAILRDDQCGKRTSSSLSTASSMGHGDFDIDDQLDDDIFEAIQFANQTPNEDALMIGGDEKRIVEDLVKQSLQHNMLRIMRRANLEVGVYGILDSPASSSDMHVQSNASYTGDSARSSEVHCERGLSIK